MEENRRLLGREHEDLRRVRAEEAEVQRRLLEEERRNQTAAEALRSQNLYRLHHENRLSNEIRRQLLQRDLDRQQLLDQRMIDHQRLERAKMEDAERMRKDWLDEVAWQNKQLADQAKRRRFEDALEERRRVLNEVQSPDPHAVMAQDHLIKARGAHPFLRDAYRQGLQDYTEQHRQEQLGLVQDYRNTLMNYVATAEQERLRSAHEVCSAIRREGEEFLDEVELRVCSRGCAERAEQDKRPGLFRKKRNQRPADQQE